jgi:hypothetical protein
VDYSIEKNREPGAVEFFYRQALAAKESFEQSDLDYGLQVDLAVTKVPAASKGPGASSTRGAVLAVRGEVLLARGEVEPALDSFRRAASAAPEDVEILYALYRHSKDFERRSATARQGLTMALERLAALRPENLVVVLERGRRALEAADRGTASAAYLRTRELLWDAPDAATDLLGQVLGALEAGDLAAARVPALRLENVLRTTTMYRGSLGELWTNVQGLPLLRFIDEPPPTAFGEPLALRFDGQQLAPEPGTSLAVADFDGDLRPDIARIVPGAEGGQTLEIRRAANGFEPERLPAPPGLSGLLAADLANRGHLDLVGFGNGPAVLFRGRGDGGFDLREGAGLPRQAAVAAAVLDYDIEGDLDLALAGAGGLVLVRNALEHLQTLDPKALPRRALQGAPKGFEDLVASDLDRDGDLDLLLAHAGGLLWLDNLRQGHFSDRTAESGLAAAPPAHAIWSADFDADGLSDLVSAGNALSFWHNRGGTFEPWGLTAEIPATLNPRALLAFDADNDGRLDLAAAGPGGVVVLQRRTAEGFAPAATRGAPPAATALAAADLDDDGDLDLVTSGPEGLHLLKNRGGNRNASLVVRLRGLVEGNSKNNLFGIGSTLELWAGDAYQFREVTEPVTHLGLGGIERADLLRVVWTNGVPDNRFDPESNQDLVEEQELKGSCPFLYAWDGEGFRFVTALLWGAPLGMPLAPGVWAPADPAELVAIEGLVPRDGAYHLRVTEELWEAAFFDHLRLWVVDHPRDVEVASSLRIVPGRVLGEAVLGSRGLRAPVAARDGRGDNVTARIVARDAIYADGYEPGPYQGMAKRPWAFTFDLGEAPGGPVRLHLDGWIFPADASLNLALAQRPELAPVLPRLEMETAEGWVVLMPNLGFPAGKTKTLVVDTPPLPPGVRRLRIVTTHWLSWDRIAWTTTPTPDLEPVATLLPARADLRFRGFSSLVREAPNAPHHFDYHRASERAPYAPLPGCYTRYGDVRELLESPDDRSVILASGDELALVFDARHLPPPPAGWRRTLFLESHGWDKDADRNTFAGHRLEPLPFRAMSGYPWGEGESFPDTPELRAYRQEWLTRAVRGWAGPSARPICPTGQGAELGEGLR